MDKQSLERFAEELRQAKPEEAADRVLRGREIIERLRPEIEALLSAGYSRSSIGSHLRRLGLPIAPDTVWRYLRAARAKAAGRKRRSKSGARRSRTAKATRKEAQEPPAVRTKPAPPRAQELVPTEVPRTHPKPPDEAQGRRRRRASFEIPREKPLNEL